MELYKKHRPKSLDSIVGQKEAVSILNSMIKENNIPHAVLLSGPSGCGKTTIVRIISNFLNCGESDFYEINGSASRGIDDIRRIENRMNSAPISGDCKIYYIDECHKLTNDAQNALLKPLEDTPSHVYFFLSTTAPDKIINTIKTRTTHLKLKSLTKKDVKKLLDDVMKKENIKLSEDVVDAIVENSNGSARMALVLLDQVRSIDEDKQLSFLLLPEESTKKVYDLFRCLVSTTPSWNEVCSIIKELEEEPETIRRVILSTASTILLKGKSNKKMYNILSAFRDHYYDCGKAGLVMSCYEVVHNL